MVEKLNINVDKEKLLEVFNFAFENLPWTNTSPTVQSGVSVESPNSADYLQACLMKMEAESEKQFQYLAAAYQKTYLQELISIIPFEVYRWRWMILNPKSCYSIHRDWTERIHVPVISNDQSYLIFKEETKMYQLEVGSAYKVNTMFLHTAINGHDSWRVHLVGCIKK
jgi:hypothetical protein